MWEPNGKGMTLDSIVVKEGAHFEEVWPGDALLVRVVLVDACGA